MKKLFGFATAALVSLGFFSTSAAAATVVNTDVLNVRQGPTTGSSVVGHVTSGQTLNVTKRLNGWLQIQYNGKTAYVSTSYTKETGAAPTGSKYSVGVATINVRTGPGTNYPVLGQLHKGQAVQVTQNLSGDWMKMNYNGQVGYVYKPYITSSTGQKSFYVQATAYTPYESATGITKLGYNVRQNPNMKLIAVDPSVIPLGSKVWVEGYGEAVAGDTGGAIKGNRIDVLMPTTKQALQWGRKTVKVTILK